ncbi:hypothetical protein AN391_03282 [Pseudoalteromonas sp. P1-13-1a]|uniref:Uncharacterized protein n=1 Tax=Pseudoalteromonas undina TaxID=43660 RepID=A0ACC6R3K1_9GAMM|nr:hypothetical protein [Pseudoalteromonas sp. P1-13-1a]KPZ53630.1 hypothetical protein AN391_03282 [Pseudoalteromonas sp. P1-13-1a]
MPDVTALFYIAIMAFYLLHKNEEAKILVPVIGFAAIPLFSNDYWQWFQLSAALSVVVIVIEKEKAGYTGGGAVSAFAAFFIGALLVSIFIHATSSAVTSLKSTNFNFKHPLSYEWSREVVILYASSFITALLGILFNVRMPAAHNGLVIIAGLLAVLPHFCGSFLYGLALSVIIIVVTFLVALVKKAQEEARVTFLCIGAGLMQVSCLVKYFS